MFVIETQPPCETKRQHWVWFTANMLKASGTVLSSFKSIYSAEHFKKTKGKLCRIFAVVDCSDQFPNFLWPSGSELIGFFVLHH